MIKVLDYRPRGHRFQHHYSNRDFFTQEFTQQKVRRCILKVFPPEVYTASFIGDVKPSVPGDLVKVGSCLLQALISHYCGKPLRGNKNK